MSTHSSTPAQVEEQNTRFQLGRIVGALEELPGRMDRFEAQVTADLAEIKQNTLTHSTRIGSLEQKQAKAAGIAGLFGAGLGAGLSGWLTHWLKI